MSTLQRNPVQILEDAICKHRVLKGIRLLEEHYGPNWADVVDLDKLDLSSCESCVLGQLYADVEPTEEQQKAFCESYKVDNGYWPDLHGLFTDGFTIGRAIIDGPLLGKDGVKEYGFDCSHVDSLDAIKDFSDEQLADIGATREMVNAAVVYATESERREGVYISYHHLDAEWAVQVALRRDA